MRSEGGSGVGRLSIQEPLRRRKEGDHATDHPLND